MYIANSRWQLRKLVREVNEILNRLKIKKHPDKTYIGKAEKGFDFLGYFIRPGSIQIAQKTLKKFEENINQLYEQGAVFFRIGQYISHWVQWAKGGKSTFGFCAGKIYE